MLLTGLYPGKNGIWNNCLVGRNEDLKDDVKTITDLFFEEGYNTAYFGKCHWKMPQPFFDEVGNYVGKAEAPGGNYPNKYDIYIPPGPARHHIEYFYQSVKDSHFHPLIYSNDPTTIEGKKDGEIHQPTVYTPKNEAEKIVGYLRNKNNVRDTDKPFCMIWSLNPPHSPYDDANTDMPFLRKYYDKDKFPHIDSNLVVRKNASLKVADFARNYFAAVTSVDFYIGQVLNELEKMGELDNTIVLLSSDHGELMGSHELTGKNHVETESLAVPLIVHWSKGLKADINDALFGTPDIMPTLMGLAGMSNKIPKQVEGNNFSTLLLNKTTKKIPQPEAVLIMLGNSRGVHTKRYTLTVTENKKEWESKVATKVDATFIYDNLKDTYQLHEMSLEELPEVSKQLLSELGTLLKKYNDPWYQKRKYSQVIPYPKG